MGVLQAILHKWYVIYLQLPTTYDIIYQALSYRLYYLYFKFFICMNYINEVTFINLENPSYVDK